MLLTQKQKFKGENLRILVTFKYTGVGAAGMVIFSGQPERFDCVYKLYSISSVYVTHTHTHH